MSLADLLNWGFKQIRARFLESALIILGIGLGVAAICSVVSLIEEFTNQAASEANQLQNRIFEIAYRPASQMQDFNAPVQRIGRVGDNGGVLDLEDYQKIRDADIPGKKYTWVAAQMGEEKEEVSAARPMGEASYEEHLKWERENILQFCLATPDIFQVAGLNLVKGDFFGETDLRQKKKVAVIGDELAKDYFADANPINQTITVHEGTFTVIGVVHSDMPTDSPKYHYLQGIGQAENLNWIMYIPYTSYPVYTGNPGEGGVGLIYVMAGENIELSAFHGQLKEYLARNFPEGLTASGYYTFQQESKKMFFNFGSTLGIFACAALLIAAINVLNLMLARVLRRYKHIGISAALGASKRDIFNIFLTEAIILGLFGTVFGLFLTLGALKLLGNLIHQSIGLTFLTVGVGVGVAVLTSLIFGLYPASQAAYVQPGDALKME